MNIFPKISIVTPSYNQGKFIEETINSVLGQGYRNLEYVIIDGGSKDGTLEIIKKYEKHLHYWVSEADNGHGHALNKGFAKTTGEIMAWINSDDKYTPWAFRTVAEIFQNFPHVDWIVGINSWWNSSGAMIGTSKSQKNIYDYLLGNYAWIQQESVFWRRSLWERSGGFINENYNFMVDGELWTRFFLHAELYSVDCVLGGYRFHDANRAKKNWQNCLDEMERSIKDMKTKCPYEYNERAKKLKIIRYINRYFFLKSKVFPKIASKFFKYANYKNICFKNDKWAERIIPFTYK